MKVTQIVPGLYQRGEARHLSRAVKAAAVRDLKIGLVINLWRNADDDLFRIMGGNANYVWMPQPDSHHFNWNAAHAAAAMAGERIRAGQSVLVQCQAGRNRSGAVSALIVRWLRGCSGAEALALVRAARPGAVANAAMEYYLRSLK